MTVEESQAIFKKLASGEDLSELFLEHPDDRSKIKSDYLKDLLDWKDFLEYRQRLNKGTVGETGRGLVSSDRTLHREFLRGKIYDPTYREDSDLWFDMMGNNTYQKGFLKYRRQLSENKALLALFKAATHDLLRAQDLAAEARPGFLKKIKKAGLTDPKNKYMF